MYDIEINEHLFFVAKQNGYIHAGYCISSYEAIEIAEELLEYEYGIDGYDFWKD